MSAPGKRGRSLSAALGKVTPAEPAVLQPPTPATPEPAPSKKLVAVAMYVSPADHDRLRDLSHHSRTSLQKLGIEAWNLLLESRGHAPLAPTTADRPSGRTRG